MGRGALTSPRGRFAIFPAALSLTRLTGNRASLRTLWRLLALFDGAREVQKIVLGDILRFVDESGERGFEFLESRILFHPGLRGNGGTEFFYPHFQR
jgi:hypothetical protein